MFVSTADTRFSYYPPSHVISCPSSFPGSFTPVVSESYGVGRWGCATLLSRSDPSAVDSRKGSAHCVRGHVQLSTARCVADSGGFAARKWPWHSPISGGSHHRGPDARRGL